MRPTPQSPAGKLGYLLKYFALGWCAGWAINILVALGAVVALILFGRLLQLLQ